MLRRITPQTTLDNLRREAKRRLKALRDGALPHGGLRDVQHALAREYGFAGWAALKAAVESGPSNRERATAEVQQAALDLVAAHDTGDPDALKRLGQHYGHRVTHEDVRALAWERVYALRQRSSAGGERHLDISEARELVAREEGFGNWTAFVTAVAAGRPAPGRAWEIDRNDDAIRPRRVLKARRVGESPRSDEGAEDRLTRSERTNQ